MRDYKFYAAGMDPARFSWLVVPGRRAVRRLLRPVFYRQEELFAEFGNDIDELKAQVAKLSVELEALKGLVWDHVAVTRRLAALEDRIGDTSA